MDDKAEDFTECLLGDIYACVAEAVDLEIEYTEEEKERFVPDDFFCKIITFSKVIVGELMPDMSRLPVLFFDHEDFFRRFTTSVCLKLINNVDPEIGFLKVMAFLILITTTSFLHTCYQPLDLLHKILHLLLKDHIKTKFYEEGRFDDIVAKSAQLKEDEKWCESTIEEMRTCLNDALETELAATHIVKYDPLKPDRKKIRLIDVKSKTEQSSEEENPDSICKYCNMKCIFFLKEFFRPKIRYKPDCSAKK